MRARSLPRWGAISPSQQCRLCGLTQNPKLSIYMTPNTRETLREGAGIITCAVLWLLVYLLT